MKKIVIIASGPSLTQEQVDYCKDKADVMVINDNYKLAPWADWLYACDFDWWGHHYKDIRKSFSGELWTQDERAIDAFANINIIEGTHKRGLGKDGIIHFGQNSGYQAINLAYLWGYTEIILIGYDMKLDYTGRRHWFGDHPQPLDKKANYDKWISNFQGLALDLEEEGIKVYNCTTSTALDCFEIEKLENVL